jgi:LmbE family N-acetylglucosaminyl deacetylase
MRLMAVMAHPDDAEIWCGGTFMLHADRGDDVHICTLSYAEDSQRGLEASESARQMGCQVEFLGMQDAGIRDTQEAVDLVWRCMESFQPDTIITHWHDDMHPDHEATFCIVRRALLKSILVKPVEDIQSFPRIFCCDSMGSIGLHGPFKPDRYVDVTDSWDKKMAAINIHQSQQLWIYLEMIDKQCLAHGRDAGKKRAEGFLYLPLFGFADNGPPLGG